MFRLIKKLKNDREWLMAVRVSGMFLFLGGLWILFSDNLVLYFFDDPQVQACSGTSKEIIVFVALPVKTSFADGVARWRS